MRHSADAPPNLARIVPIPRPPRLPWALAGALLALLFAGCSKTETPPAEQPKETVFEGVHLVVAVPAERGVETTLKPYLDEWAAQTGATAALVSYDSQQPETAFTAAEGAAAAPAVALLPLRSLPDLAAAQRLAVAPKDAVGEDALDWLDLFPGVREGVGSLEGTPTVVPISCPTLVLYYRQDLLEQAGLKPPETWDDYHRLVETLNDWAPGLTAVEPWSDEWRTTCFLAKSLAVAKHPSQYSLFFDFRTGEPLIDSPAFVHALEKCLATLRLLSQDSLKFSPFDCRDEIVSGRAALAIGYEPSTPKEDGAAVTATGGIVIACRRLPGSETVYNRSTGKWEPPPTRTLNHASLVGFDGWYFAVSRQAEAVQQSAGWNLIAAAGVRQLAFSLPPRFVTLCRDSQLSGERAGRWGGDLPRSAQDSYAQAVAASLNGREVIWELPVVGADAFRRALTEGLTKTLNGNASPQEALTAVKRQWEQTLEELDRTVVLNSYRRGLGLSALE